MALVVVAVAFLVTALVTRWDTFVSGLRLDAGRLSVAVVSGLAGYGCLGRSWAVLHPRRSTHGSLLRRFLIAQPAKYVPGGIAMPAGQVLLSRALDSSTAASGVRLVVHSALMAFAAALLGITLLPVSPMVAVAGFGIGLVGAGALLSIDTQVAVDFFARLSERFGRRLIVDVRILRPMVAAALGWAIVGLALLGMAFVAVAEAAIPGVAGNRLAVFGGYQLAWAVGFVLVPLPSGAGAREAVLATTLGSVAPLASWVAVSLVHRAASLAAELIGGAWATVVERRAESNTRSDGDGTTIP